MRHIPLPFLAAALLIGVSNGFADGGFFWNKAADLNEPSQKAIIHWADGREVLVIQVKYEGQAEDFAWVVPLPARPEIHAIPPADDPFAEISYFTQHRPREGLRGAHEDGDGPREPVTLLERKVVGVYDVAVLSASDPVALSQWLNNNGFAFPEKRADVLQHYTGKKWVYVAMRIDRKALNADAARKLNTGELQPIRFTFASERMVYPLRISSVNAGQTEVLLYLLAKTPMVLNAPQKLAALFPTDQIISQHCYRSDSAYGTDLPVTAERLPATWNALRLPDDAALYVCKYRAVCRAEEMLDDLVFAPFASRPYWECVSASETAWYEKAAILELLIGHDEKQFAPRLQSLLDEAAASSNPAVKYQAARHPKVSAKLCEALAVDQDSTVRGILAANPHAPTAVLRKLADDADASIRRSVATNAAADASILRRLANDADLNVVSAVAENASAPPEVLQEIARSGVAARRIYLAKSRRCPYELQAVLAEDKDTAVRKALAVNAHLAPAALAKLAADPSFEVRALAASHSTIPKATLGRMALDKDPGVRQSVAANPNAGIWELRRLAGDADGNVAAAAQGELTLAETLPARVVYYGDNPHVRLRDFELELPERRIRRLDRNPRPSEAAMLRRGSRELLQREPWEALGDEELARIAARLKAWLLSRPPSTYYRGGGLGDRSDSGDYLVLFYPRFSEAERLRPCAKCASVMSFAPDLPPMTRAGRPPSSKHFSTPSGASAPRTLTMCRSARTMSRRRK